MAKRCQISGKTVMSGNNVSHANNRTRRRFAQHQATRMHSEVLNRRSVFVFQQAQCGPLKNMVVSTRICCRRNNAELAVEARELKREIATAKPAK